MRRRAEVSSRKRSREMERAISSHAIISRENTSTSLPCWASWSAICIQKAVLPRELTAPMTYRPSYKPPSKASSILGKPVFSGGRAACFRM